MVLEGPKLHQWVDMVDVNYNSQDMHLYINFKIRGQFRGIKRDKNVAEWGGRGGGGGGDSQNTKSPILK